MRPLNAEDIRGAFLNATEDELAQLTLPGLHEVIWEDREFLGWRDARAPRRGYIVYWHDDAPRGIVLRAADFPAARPRTEMCSLCHTMQAGHQVTLFSAAKAGRAGAEGSTVGTYICSDLGCSHLIRILPAPSPLLPDPQEVVARRSEALHGRLDSFTGTVLAGER